MNIISIWCSNTFKKWLYYTLDLIHVHATIFVSMTYFLSCDTHEYNYFQDLYINRKKSHINFTIILHNVSYNTCNSDY